MASVRDLDVTLTEADCVVIATGHSAYDWGEIAGKASLVMDTRRVRGYRSSNSGKERLQGKECEVISGRPIFCRDAGERAIFASLTAREYENEMAMTLRASMDN